tara:strand:+ start:2255 stop:3277 length:1023 start_codon:yes stop_codon:yes gene_type:complete
MAGAIFLRSPNSRFAINASTHLSVKMTITINGTLAYTIIKPSTAGVYVLFEYAELARDYINITWNGSYSGYSPQTNMVILTVINFWDAAHASGSQVGTDASVTQYGVNGYSNFLDGANNNNLGISDNNIPNDATMISNYTQDAAGTKTYTVYAPKDRAVTIPYLNSTGTETLYSSSGINATSVTLGNSQLINIVRLGCNKYDEIPVTFINKWGAIQREYFILKSIQKVSAKREQYQKNIISNVGNYSINEHTKQNFNISANEEMTVNSDYLPEYYNQVYTELLLSEQVWIYLKPFSTNTFTAVPVNITSSDLTYKTSVNDRLINFTFTFQMSYDYINNVR